MSQPEHREPRRDETVLVDPRQRAQTPRQDLPLDEEDRGQRYRDPMPVWLYRAYFALFAIVVLSAAWYLGVLIENSIDYVALAR